MDTRTPVRPRPFVRRLSFGIPVMLSVIAGAYAMFDILNIDGMNAVELIILFLFVPCFVWICWSFWLSVFGFAIRLIAKDPIAFAAPLSVDYSLPLTARIAVVMPIYNEDPERVFTGLENSIKSLQGTREAHAFSFFVLSDSDDLELAADEHRRWQELRARLGARHLLSYRRRRHNTGRKVGNIAEFCEQWGRCFDFMVMLDADSVMSGDTLVRLARLMQANPNAGIIQTVPTPVNHITAFARLIQFGCRLCSEMLTTGQSYWQLDAGNYFGHNAIIRIRPFMQHCRLPILSGRPPFGGAILSHDFVEAAFMRRAGWEVWHLPDASGSYEETPTNVLDHVIRDRRWCQGNLQHLRLLFAKGLHPISRIHFVIGVLAYLASPIWVLLLMFGLIRLVHQSSITPLYFGADFSLFPMWPIIKSSEAILLFVITILMLLAPKILGMVLALLKRDRRRAFGGSARVLLSTIVDILFSALLAPAMMVFHLMFVTSILSGRSVEWRSQARVNRTIAFLDVFSRLRWQFVLGALIGVIVMTVTPALVWWFSPLLFGLLLSTPIAVVVASSDVGQKLLRMGIFAIPEERQVPDELEALTQSSALENIDDTRRDVGMAVDAPA